jgi:dTDP-4-amino-4,6-dideoxyglucose
VPANSRDNLVHHFHENDILVRRYFHPGCHHLEPYKSDPSYNNSRLLPKTENVASKVLVFPTGYQMNKEGVNRVFDAYTSFVKQK